MEMKELFSTIIEEKYKHLGNNGELIVAIIKDATEEMDDFVLRMGKYLDTLNEIDKSAASIMIKALISYTISSFTQLNINQIMEVLEFIESKM